MFCFAKHQHKQQHQQYYPRRVHVSHIAFEKNILVVCTQLIKTRPDIISNHVKSGVMKSIGGKVMV